MKRLVLLFAVFLLSVSFISAVEIEMDSSYDSGETFIAKISGNFVDSITKDNIEFYRGNVKIPIIFDVTKYENDFYLYAVLLDKQKGDYSFKISDVKYKKGTATIDDEIIQNFSVSNSTAEFSVNPGFIVTDNDFSIKIKNLQEKNIEISITTSENIKSENSVEILEGEEKTINFNLIDPLVQENIIFSSGNYSYEFKGFFVFGEEIPEEPEDKKGTENVFKFEPSSLEISMATESEGKRILLLKNTGEKIKNIVLVVSEILQPYVELSVYEIDKLDTNEEERIELSVISDVNEAIVEGFIIAESGNLSTSSILVLDFVEDFIPIDGQSESSPSVSSCSEVGGEICSENAECEGDTFYASDGVCCLGSCKETKENKGGRILGWFLIIALIIIAIWFYKSKFKKAK